MSWVTYLTPREAVRAAKELLGGRLEQDRIKRRTGPAKPAQPAPAEAATPPPTEAAAVEAAAEERPRKKVLTKSEEQKRAARARAKLRRRGSRQTA